jgi:hypothetical protein
LINRQQFLEPGESVLMISAVKKLQKITSKKVQLILTNKPKLIYVDPSKLVVKGNIIWSDNSNDLNVVVTSPSHFKICTVLIISLFFYPPKIKDDETEIVTSSCICAAKEGFII